MRFNLLALLSAMVISGFLPAEAGIVKIISRVTWYPIRYTRLIIEKDCGFRESFRMAWNFQDEMSCGGRL